jgi:hypothetical protein
MRWFSRTQSSLNALPQRTKDVPWSTFMEWTTTYGIDPPRLSQYQAALSPSNTDHQCAAVVTPGLAAINEVIPYPPTSPHLSETAPSIKHPPKYTSNQLRSTAVPTRPASPLSECLNQTPYVIPPIDQASVLPPIQTVSSPIFDKTKKTTCSLNLMCYRPGSQGCIRRQIQVISLSRWAVSSDDGYDRFWQEKPDLIRNDQEFFHALHREYEQHICGFWRRYLSLKTLRQIRLLSVRSVTISWMIIS